MDEKYLLIKKNLIELKKLDPKYQAFGADRWRYFLFRHYNWKIRRLEKRNAVSLPTEFREFINIVGFGAGPVYGVRVFESLAIEKREFYSDESLKYKDTPYYDRYIVIAEHGCGNETTIIIDGLHKGEIWRYQDYRFFKVSDGYYKWYLTWTENLIKILKSDGHIGILSGSL